MTKERRSLVQLSLRMKLKKRLKRWKRPLWSLAVFLLFAAVLAIGLRIMDETRELTDRSILDNQQVQAVFASGSEQWAQSSTEQVIEQVKSEKKKLRVIQRTSYVCGHVDRSLGKQSAAQIINTLLEHPNWVASMNANNDVVLEERIDDLSDTCKDRAYIGLDKDGNLTLYEDVPEKEKVMRTFFQLDVESMESALPPQVLKQLHDGIRISDIDEYHSVISTFSDYAIEETKGVMKQTPPAP
ncbi:BofC C-terminal domain-containing protein [Paenibacillus sp. 1001270B_150601_E10]|uniref:BofC C-terminal domain-containing protein n=1 Tax=Paenibacillus sp. 1001270B_150601_E10 TaxID=2787079 RepID=UPI00189D88F2|nr:BofC C-terminal domain-containing protein [Paenibacillus sp. 1001270B_150601_E10]